jgi:hypothetical protein
MSNDQELDQLRRDVAYLKDRLAILDCVNTQSRGHDRHDAALMASVYHGDGIDEHGATVKLGPEYGEWANQVHAAVFADHLHNITTHTCEIDGDEAHCESYVIGTMVSKDGASIMLMGGRYLDRLEHRDGEWKLALRRCTIEWALPGDASMLQSGAFAGFLKGRWDPSDLSYARPLQLESEPADRW